MYLTILSGRVAPVNQTSLEKAYEQAVKHPAPGLLQSFLVHNCEDPNLWQIISVWQSQDAFRQAEKAGTAHTCVQLFCEAGSIPARATFDIHERYLRV